MAQTTRLLLIRHAESEANANNIMQGWHESPLSARGEEQATQLAQWLRENNPGADALFSSPLQRAYQTASHIGEALGLPVQVRDGLRELGMGKIEDEHYSKLPEVLKDPNFEEVYDMEPMTVLAERVLGTLYGIIAFNEGKTIIVVAHGGVIGATMAYWIDRDLNRAWSHYYTRNTSITELRVTSPLVELVNYDQLEYEG